MPKLLPNSQKKEIKVLIFFLNHYLLQSYHHLPSIPTVPDGYGVSLGMTGDGALCSGQGCQSHLTWDDGTAFVWEPWMAAEIIGRIAVKYRARCFIFINDKIEDQDCGHWLWAYGVCQRPCGP